MKADTEYEGSLPAGHARSLVARSLRAALDIAYVREGFGMNRLTFPASIFSVACQRCGSALRKNAESCPNCGADRDAAFGESPGAFKPSGSTALASASHVGGTGVASAAQPWNAKTLDYSAIPEKGEFLPDDGIDSSAERWTHGKTAIVGSVALALAAGVAIYLQQQRTGGAEYDSTLHSVSGAIDSRSGDASGASQRLLEPLSAGSAMDAAKPAEQPPAVVAIRPSGTRGGIQAVRDAILAHDLGAARAHFLALTPQQQNSAELATVTDELAQLEIERDTALKLARACEKAAAWPCVQQNAGEALSLDGSNVESQAMLERVIAHSGWSTNAKSGGAAATLAASATPGAAPAPRRRLWAGQSRSAAAKQAAAEAAADADSARTGGAGPREATLDVTRPTTRELTAAPVDARATTAVTPPQPTQAPAPAPTQTQALTQPTDIQPQPVHPAAATTVAAPGPADLPPAAVATRASADTRSDPRPAHALSTDPANAEDLERAIKQYGWSGDNAPNKTPH